MTAPNHAELMAAAKRIVALAKIMKWKGNIFILIEQYLEQRKRIKRLERALRYYEDTPHGGIATAALRKDGGE